MYSAPATVSVTVSLKSYLFIYLFIYIHRGCESGPVHSNTPSLRVGHASCITCNDVFYYLSLTLTPCSAVISSFSKRNVGRPCETIVHVMLKLSRSCLLSCREHTQMSHSYVTLVSFRVSPILHRSFLTTSLQFVKKQSL